MDFPKLNLPPVALRTRMGDSGRTMVWDVLRRRYVTLTAEEWVRQHFVHYLLEACGYPAGLLANEMAVEVGGVRRRCDTVLFAREAARPRLIVEWFAALLLSDGLCCAAGYLLTRYPPFRGTDLGARPR